MAPSHIPVQTNIPEQQDYSRGAVIMESTAPEPKPRRKGGRKPKNDPVSISSWPFQVTVTVYRGALLFTIIFFLI